MKVQTLVRLHGPFLLLLAVISILPGQDRVADLERQLKADPRNENLLMELSRMYHDLGTAGDDDAVERGFVLVEQALTVDSANVIARAYRGRFWTMRARASWWPPTKMNYMRRGGEDLDDAVSMAPDNIMVRLLRGINSLGMPGFLGRLSSALEDFIVILRHPDFPEQTKELKGMAFYFAGVAYKRADDLDTAKELFKRVSRFLPGSEYARRAQEELDDLNN